MGTRDIFIDLAHVKKDHPHAYGDKYEIACYFLLISGSSPRVWGQAVIKSLNSVDDRIIPTRMGTRHRYLKQA